MTRQVEAEWDDLARERAEALALHDQQLCPGCGLHPVILDDPNVLLTFEDRLCKVCAAQTQKGRMQGQDDREWDEKHKDADPRTPRPGDGRHTHLRPLTPAEVAAWKATQPGSDRPQRPAGPTQSR